MVRPMDTPHTTRHVLYRNSLSKKELERSHLGPDPENRNSDCLMSDVNVNCVSVSVSVHGNLFIVHASLAYFISFGLKWGNLLFSSK